MRITSEMWVGAYLRRCQAEFVQAVVVRRGDAAAGAIFISVDLLDGNVRLYGPAPAGLAGGDAARRWVFCLEGATVAAQEAKAFLARQIAFDSDLWILEVEDRSGRHFLDDALVEA
jgi:hypothetical protein